MLNKLLNKLKHLSNNKGITVVWLGLGLFVLLIMFAGLAVDIWHMVNVKNGLGIAADASALAGAAKLNVVIDSSSTTDLVQTNARQEAWKFACKNKVADGPVYLVTNIDPSVCNTAPASSALNDTNAPDGDIVVGNWNPANSQSPIDLRFTPATGSTGLSINAIKTRPRRTGETPGMPQVSIFFGKVFGWAKMSAKASAIAAPGGLLSTPSLSFCVKSCTIAGLPKLFDIQHDLDCGADFGVAWTLFNTDNPIADSNVKKYIDGTNKLTAQDINNLCNNKCVTTKNGVGDALNYLGEKFRDTTYDADNKDISGSSVTAWRVGILITNYHCCPDSGCESCCPTPISCAGPPPTTCKCGPDDCCQGCPPSASGAVSEPYHIQRWAKVTIIQVCDNTTAGGGPGSDPRCTASGVPTKGVIISALTCTDCSNDPVGALTTGKLHLVK